MKKGLLLLGAAALCTSAFAQQECGYLNANNADVAEAWGWTVNEEGKGEWSKTKAQREAGVLMAETQNVVLRNAFADECSASGINKIGLKSYVVNGVAYSKESSADDAFEGAVGNTNPSAISNINEPVINKGWVFDYEVKEDGWLTVMLAPSLNKNFYVMAGEMSEGQVSVAGVIAYDLYIELKDPIAELDGTSFKISLPAVDDGTGVLNTEAADIANYCENGDGPIMWPIRIIKNDPTFDVAEGSDGKKNYGTVQGAAVFPVMAGVHYYVFATGSKLTAGPYVWTKEEPTQLAFTKEVKDEDENVTIKVYNLIGEYTAAVNTVEAVIDVNAPIYNAQGVRVNADAKGLLIQNGKKFIRK